jgi:hypothetical protein
LVGNFVDRARIDSEETGLELLPGSLSLAEILLNSAVPEQFIPSMMDPTGEKASPEIMRLVAGC